MGAIENMQMRAERGAVRGAVRLTPYHGRYLAPAHSSRRSSSSAAPPSRRQRLRGQPSGAQGRQRGRGTGAARIARGIWCREDLAAASEPCGWAARSGAEPARAAWRATRHPQRSFDRRGLPGSGPVGLPRSSTSRTVERSDGAQRHVECGSRRVGGPLGLLGLYEDLEEFHAHKCRPCWRWCFVLTSEREWVGALDTGSGSRWRLRSEGDAAADERSRCDERRAGRRAADWGTRLMFHCG